MPATYHAPLPAAQSPRMRRIATWFQEHVVFRALGAVADMQVRGAENLRGLYSPCIIIANHTSHLDTLCLMFALPWRLRFKLAVPAAADYWFRSAIVGGLASLFFNLVPMRRSGCPLTDMKRMDDLLARRWSLIIMPEGTRSLSGAMGRFKPGAATLAIWHGVPVLPARIAGAYEVMHKGQHVPRHGRITVTLGQPIRFAPDTDSRAATAQLEAAVRAL
ncbi:MAG: 1-acyl-sn-glycerol-3-phosphate acyltransferase [Chloroflexi bacterium]|nr:1-acyl-sn-glycerol-3-phosphate acyltransferase [Chloroflexota bacterium]